MTRHRRRRHDAQQLSRFMGCFLSKLAREVGRLYNWKEKVYG